MESGSDAEINAKVQEIINILQLPHDEFSEFSKEFDKQMQNPEIAAGVHAQVDVKVQEISKNIQLARKKLEKSFFFGKFMKQMQNPETVARIKRVICTDPRHSQLQLVLYGVGRLNPVKNYQNVERSQMQFAFSLLLRENFPWVNDIVVYDPVLSPLDRRVINEFNCTGLHVNEGCRRTVDRPTLFFMPHCAVFLYEYVLEANWTPGNLNKIIILGNSLSRYSPVSLDSCGCKRVKAVRKSGDVMHEIAVPETTIGKACPGRSPEPYTVSSYDIDGDPVFRRAFEHSSWHFFAWDGSLDQLNLDLSSKDYAQEA